MLKSWKLLVVFLGLTVAFGSFTVMASADVEKPKNKNQEKALEEDLEGRAKWWQEQRTYPGEKIPEDARQRALVQKSRMEKSNSGTDTLEEKFAEDVKGRDQWWYYQRAYPSDLIPVGTRQKALEHKRRMKGGHHSSPVAGVCNWISIGPRNINGRIRSMAIHPTNGDIVYAGAAEGGVWRSTDAGQSWYPLMQYELSIAVGALAIDPTNPNTIYAGTGEPTTWPGYEGVGVLKSTDGGATWSLTGAIGNGHIARLAIDPTNTNIVYCAGFPGGLYKTTNGAVNWSLILSGDVTDFVLNPSATNTLYAGIRNDGVYKSTNGGGTWTKLVGGLPAMASNRVMLSLCVASPQTVYAKLDQTVYKTTNGGTNWTNLGNHGGSTYGYWCTYVAVDPTDPDIVLAAGVSLERSTNGGASWTSVLGGTNWEIDRLHPDQHAMVFDPANHLRIYAGNDGGVYLSTDGCNTWKKVSDGLIVTQFYDVGISTATPSMLGGGTQDQGTDATVGGLTWHYLFDADGGFLVFHPTDPYTMYGETQNNWIRKSTDGGASWSGATSGLTGSGPWIGAIVMDEATPNTLFTGRQEVFRTTNGAANWSASSPTVGGSVLAIAIAPSNHQIVYAGTSSGKVWKSTDGGATLANWSDVTSAPLPNRYLKDIAVDPTDPDIIYVTFSGFSSSTPTTPGHVFRSADGGATWTDISGTPPSIAALPDIPVNAIEIDAHNPNILYVATDIGIFRTTNLGGVWTVFEPGFPQVAVEDLKLDESRDILTAATHGRGMWQIKVGPAATCFDVDIYIRDDFLDTGEQIPSPSNVADPFSVVRGGSIGDKVYRWQSSDIKVDTQPYYTPDALFDGVEFDRDLLHDNPVRTQLNRVYVQVHNRGPFNANNVTVKILWADATAGLPPLPPDFWTNYPNDPSNITVWHPIGTYKAIPVLEPTRPVTLFWNWTPPATAATHSCILAVIDSLDDPIPAANKSLSVNWLIGNEKHIALKNLHVVNASPGPGPGPSTEINFYNDTKELQLYDFVIDRKFFPIEGELSLKFSKLKTLRPLEQSVKGVEIVEGGEGYRYMLRITSPKVAVIKDVILEPHEWVKAQIEITIPPEAKPGSRYRFTIMQRRGEEILGGSTYEVRTGVRLTFGSYPFSKPQVLRAVLHAVPWVKLSEQIFPGQDVPVAVHLLWEGPMLDDAREVPYDPDRARALLAEAGFAGGFSLVLMLGPPEDERFTMAKMMTEPLGNIGIDVAIVAIPPDDAPVKMVVMSTAGQPVVWLTP